MLFGIEQPDPADSLLESLPVEGHVAEFGAVGIDGRRRAVQEAGDTAAVGDAQADCGEDAQFGGEGARRTGFDPRFGKQQCVDLFDEAGEDFEERGVEAAVEFGELLPQAVLGQAQPADQRFGTFGFGLAADHAPQVVQPGDIVDGEVDVLAHVTILDAVGVDQRGVDVAHPVAHARQLPVLFTEFGIGEGQLPPAVLQPPPLAECVGEGCGEGDQQQRRDGRRPQPQPVAHGQIVDHGAVDRRGGRRSEGDAGARFA